MQENSISLSISPKKIVSVLFGIVILLVLASLIGQYYKESFAGNEVVLKIIRKFNVDFERNNLPTWYQSSTLLLSSFLLLVIALIRKAKEDRDFRYWGILSAVFLYLSMDEAVSIHEQLTMPLRTSFELGGFFYLSWVIPAIVFLLIFFATFFKFLTRLPDQIRYLMIASGVIYILGAVVMEMIGGNYLYVTNDLPSRVVDFQYALITTFEEFLEMMGILLFIYTLLTYLQPQAEMKTEEKKAKNFNTINDLKRKVVLN